MRKKVVFIINPKAGKCKSLKIYQEIEKKIDYQKFEVSFLFTERAGHAEDLAREQEADIVVAVGGDGTVNEVARGLIKSSKKLGIIPCGSGNGLARHLGIPMNIGNAVEVINQEETEVIDSALFGDNPFFCTAGVGLDAAVAFGFANAKGRGLFNYIKSAIKEWIKFSPSEYIIDIDGFVLRQKASIITVGNANQWGNNAKITPKASVKDGLLDVSIISPFRFYDVPCLVFKLMVGKLNTSHKTTMLRGRVIKIYRDQEAAAHFDGEPCMRGKHLEMMVLPGVLNIIIPTQI